MANFLERNIAQYRKIDTYQFTSRGGECNRVESIQVDPDKKIINWVYSDSDGDTCWNYSQNIDMSVRHQNEWTLYIKGTSSYGGGHIKYGISAWNSYYEFNIEITTGDDFAESAKAVKRYTDKFVFNAVPHDHEIKLTVDNVNTNGPDTDFICTYSETLQQMRRIDQISTENDRQHKRQLVALIQDTINCRFDLDQIFKVLGTIVHNIEEEVMPTLQIPPPMYTHYCDSCHIETGETVDPERSSNIECAICKVKVGICCQFELLDDVSGTTQTTVCRKCVGDRKKVYNCANCHKEVNSEISENLSTKYVYRGQMIAMSPKRAEIDGKCTVWDMLMCSVCKLQHSTRCLEIPITKKYVMKMQRYTV